jgi:hypothetical protein
MTTPHQEQRQQARDGGRYQKMVPCPRCGKRRALEPGYTVQEGGLLPSTSKWAGHFICQPCIKAEAALLPGSVAKE